MITIANRAQWEKENYEAALLKFQADLHFAKEYAQLKRIFLLQMEIKLFPTEIWNLILLFGTDDPNVFEIFLDDYESISFVVFSCQWTFHFGHRSQLCVLDLCQPQGTPSASAYNSYSTFVDSWYDLFSTECETMPFTIIDSIVNKSGHRLFVEHDVLVQEATRNVLIEFRNHIYQKISKKMNVLKKTFSP
jgi:hypothetical protein